MHFLYTLHSHNRWLVLAAAALVLLKLTLTWLSRGEYSKADAILVKLYSWLTTVQVVIGLVLAFSLGWTMYRIEHGVTMLIALAAIHFSARWKAAPGPVRARNTALMITVSILLIVAGIMRLPQGWSSGIHQSLMQ